MEKFGEHLGRLLLYYTGYFFMVLYSELTVKITSLHSRKQTKTMPSINSCYGILLPRFFMPLVNLCVHGPIKHVALALMHSHVQCLLQWYIQDQHTSNQIQFIWMHIMDIMVISRTSQRLTYFSFTSKANISCKTVLNVQDKTFSCLYAIVTSSGYVKVQIANCKEVVFLLLQLWMNKICNSWNWTQE